MHRRERWAHHDRLNMRTRSKTARISASNKKVGDSPTTPSHRASMTRSYADLSEHGPTMAACHSSIWPAVKLAFEVRRFAHPATYMVVVTRHHAHSGLPGFQVRHRVWLWAATRRYDDLRKHKERNETNKQVCAALKQVQ